MITVQQQNKIRDYLLAKNLPIDILMEVQDHFISQITDISRENNLIFEDAFSQVKEFWAQELSTFYPFYILRKTENVLTTKFEQRIRKREFIRGIRQSFIATSIIMLTGAFVLVLNKNFIVPYIKYSILLCSLFCYGILLYNLIINNFAYKKKFATLKFSIYHWRIYFAFGFSGLALQFLTPIASWITTINTEFYYKITTLFFVFICLIYTGIAQFNFAKVLRRIKPYLKFV